MVSEKNRLWLVCNHCPGCSLLGGGKSFYDNVIVFKKKLNHFCHLCQLHQSRGIPGTKPFYHVAAVVTNRIWTY